MWIVAGLAMLAIAGHGLYVALPISLVVLFSVGDGFVLILSKPHLLAYVVDAGCDVQLVNHLLLGAMPVFVPCVTRSRPALDFPCLHLLLELETRL